MSVSAAAFDVTSRDRSVSIVGGFTSLIVRHLLFAAGAVTTVAVALAVIVVGANWLLSKMPSTRQGDIARADLKLRLTAREPDYPRAAPGLGPADIVVFPPAVATADATTAADDAARERRRDRVPVPAELPAALAQLRAAERQVASAPALPIPKSEHREAKPATSAPPLGSTNRTAVYDISARTVFMPNGKTLEAHSGLGDWRDDPRYIRMKMRGPTPPNTYDLSLRESLFHGVRAIRLTPVDDGKMYGRAGMLAHTYMLGPEGDSNGCVSFRNYTAFLQAYLKGDVDRLIVVPRQGAALMRSVLAKSNVHYAAK